MEVMVFLSVVFLCLMYYTYVYVKRDKLSNQAQETIKLQDKWLLIIVLAAGFLIRVAFGIQPNDKSGDLSNFRWAVDTLLNNGYKSVYESGVNISFPPLLVQILALIGAVCKLFKLNVQAIGASAAIILFKLPSIICELVIASLIFKAAKRNFTKRGAIILAAAFLLNPAALMDTGICGQMDSIVSMCTLLMCWFLYEKKSGFAIISFAAAVLLNPLMVILAPVLVIGVLDDLVFDGFEMKKAVNVVIGLAISIVGGILICLPMGLSTVWNNFKQCYGAFPYCSVNAYNFWTMIDYNWMQETTTYLGLTCRAWGSIFVCLFAVAAIVWHYVSKRKKTNYFYLGSFFVIIVFTFSTRMHERYLYNAMAILLMLFVLKPFVENYILYAVFTLVQIGNMAFVYYVYDPNKFNSKEPVPNLISKVLFIGFIAFIVMVIYRMVHKETVVEVQSVTQDSVAIEKEEQKPFVIERTSKMPKWTKVDTIALLAIMIAYSAFALHDIGYRYAPHTQWSYTRSADLVNSGDVTTIEPAGQITLDLGESKYVQTLKYYLGNFENRKFTIEYADSLDGPWQSAGENEWVSVFCWGENALNIQTRYIRLSNKDNEAVVFELALVDADGKLIMPANASEYANLFDEQKMVPERSTFRDSTYFDEIYHARTAYEYIHGLKTYETTHPPLGKIIMSIGVRVFGMNPFGWRIMGILFGIAMIPIFYILSRRIFKESWIAIVSTIMFSFDFMHFAQTRIATIDVFVTFFIICSYYFMYKYYKTSFYDTKLKDTFVTLGCCGVLMGCQIAAKWTGVYAAIGLAVIFFITLGKRFREYLYAKKDVSGSTNGISHEYIVNNFVPFAWKTIGFCCIVFVAIPAVIYVLSYIPFNDGQGTTNVFTKMFNNQSFMLSYHKGVNQDHPYSSRWWQWPIMYRPIWYFSGHVSDTVSEGISAFGNPAVWWAGIPAFFYLVQRAFRKKDKKAIFLVIGYLSQYLPWVFIGRTTFIYHYFTSVPFVVLMVAYCMYLLQKEKKWPKGVFFGYVVLVLVLFVMFYPVLAGQPINKEYVFHVLRWMKSWVLVT